MLGLSVGFREVICWNADPYGVLCPGMVAISLKGHRVSGEGSNEYNKNREGSNEDGV